jgi:hypothetical protein
MVGARSRTSCRQLFKELSILTLASLYILEVTCFIRKYCQSVELSSSVHNYNTLNTFNITCTVSSRIFLYRACCYYDEFYIHFGGFLECWINTIQRKMDIHIQSYKTDIYKKSVINMGNKVYNKLPGYV